MLLRKTKPYLAAAALVLFLFIFAFTMVQLLLQKKTKRR